VLQHRASLIKLEVKFDANEMPYAESLTVGLFRFRRNGHLRKVIVLQQFYELDRILSHQAKTSVAEN
jgi:hypothetical protein